LTAFSALVLDHFLGLIVIDEVTQLLETINAVATPEIRYSLCRLAGEFTVGDALRCLPHSV